jgi:Tfp pilus assembly protein PilF
MGSKEKLASCAWVGACILALGAMMAWPLAWAQGKPLEPGSAAPASDNRISDLAVSQGPDGRWQATFSYQFAGATALSIIHIYLEPRDTRSAPPGAARPAMAHRPVGAPSDASAFLTPVRGRHQASVEIMRPMHTREALSTTHVSVELQAGGAVLAQQRIEQRIDWPDMSTWMDERQWGRQSNADLLKRAIHDIDAGGDPSSLRQARQLLERVLSKDPACDQCHLELARIAMKSNWGPEGLRQAESYIDTARRLRPEGANARILLGYVYTHQGRYGEAEALLAQAARGDPKNNWLWANWGELLALQGRTAQAIEKYREAMRRPARTDGFDYARQDAYQNLLVLLTQQKDFDGLEALYRDRAAEVQAGACDSVGYANFMLSHRGDSAKARELMERELALGCRSEPARQLLGMALYHAWSGSGKPPKEELLHKARIYLPPGTNMVYLLATSDHTLTALRLLKAQGEVIDQQDNARFNALFYATQYGDVEAAVRLLKLGAAADAPVGRDAIPLAVWLVQGGNVDAIRAFKRAGVDFSRIRHGGWTAVEIARRQGNPRVIEALGQSL